MLHTKTARLAQQTIGLLTLLLFTTFAQAQSLAAPDNVKASVYSSTAAELFWTPQAGSLVEVTRNGVMLGRFDARSLYQPNLQQKEYQYILRSVDQNGRRSSPVSVSISTVKSANPSQPANPSSSLPAPGKVQATVYSSSSAELFWTPQANTLVEVKRDDVLLGRFDTRSLYQNGLATGTYRYTLRSVDKNSDRQSSAMVVTVDLKNRTRQIETADDSTGGGGTGDGSPEQPNVDTPTEPPTVTTPVINKPKPEPETEPEPLTPNANGTCFASDVNSLLACVRSASAHKRIDLTQSIACGSNCCPNGDALLKFDGVQNLEIVGNGHRLLRTRDHRQCSLLDINNASNIVVSNVYLDDDSRVGGCQVNDRCPRMVHVRSSNNVQFKQARISNGKGYAFYVQGTNGFRFENGSLHNSGVLGMYIGHGNDASSNVRITGSTFSDNQTNGLALLGVRGSSIESNLVADNTFIRNHWRGQWAVAPKFGTGFTGGGQMYIAQATNVTVRNNVVKDGYCDNCFVQRKNRSGVSGIELGLPNKASVQNVVVSGNKVSNLDGFGISQNANSVLSNVRITNNQLLNTSSGEHVSGAQKSGNRVVNTQRFDSFENGNDLGGVYTSSVSCSANGSVTRRCGAGSRFGECAVQLKLGAADCADIKAELLGPKVSVRDGQSVLAHGWVRNPVGRWCLVFSDASGNKLGEQCSNITDAQRSNVQQFVGLPAIDARSPAGSRSVHLRVTHSNANTDMVLDDLKLSVGN